MKTILFTGNCVGGPSGPHRTGTFASGSEAIMGLGFFTSLTGLETVYLACALGGGALYVLRIAMQMFGSDSDMHHDGDMSGAGADAHHDAGADGTFKLFSLQALTAFFVMFGLVGLAASRETNIPPAATVVVAFLAGSSMMVAVALMLSFLLGLQSSGTLDMSKAVGEQGTIYMRVPEGGTGKVQVNVQNRLQTLEAIAEDKQPIATGDRVVVTAVVSGNVLVVKRIT